MRISFRSQTALRAEPRDLAARRVQARADRIAGMSRVYVPQMDGDPSLARSALGQRIVEVEAAPRFAPWVDRERMSAARNPWAPGGMNRFTRSEDSGGE